MPFDKETISQRLDELIVLSGSRNADAVGEVMSGTISVLEKVYGPYSEKVKAYIELYKDYIRNANKWHFTVRDSIRSETLGVLKSIKSEVEAGLVANLELQAQGGIFGDFIGLARKALDESKDVAAVLISAALEDTLKRYAVQNGLDVAEADMPEVINALKSKGLLKGPQASVVQSYVQLRNKAFHAEWDKIEKETVNSAISFTETFLLEHFS